MVMNKNYRYSALLRKRAVAYLKRVKVQMAALEKKFEFAKKKFATDTPKLKQQAELLEKVIKLIPESNPRCLKEKGFCVLSNGADQNSGVIKLDSVDGNSVGQQQSCLSRCLANPRSTGCEVIWDQSNRGCYVHTQSIARGNGVARHLCWVFSKCKGPKLLKRGVVFKTLPVVHKTFDVSFDMKINNFKGGKWLSVFHMTTGKSYGYGGRIPAVWVNGKDKYVHVCSGVNKNHNYYFNKKVSKDIWIKVQMKQALVKGKYVYSILIDDHLVHSVENKIPRTYKKVTAYVADKWFPALNGLIKNIKIKTP